MTFPIPTLAIILRLSVSIFFEADPYVLDH